MEELLVKYLVTGDRPLQFAMSNLDKNLREKIKKCGDILYRNGPITEEEAKHVIKTL